MHVTFSQSQNRRNIWISIAIDDVYEHACMHTYTSAQVTREEGILLSCCQASSCISILPGPRRRRHFSCVCQYFFLEEIKKSSVIYQRDVKPCTLVSSIYVPTYLYLLALERRKFWKEKKRKVIGREEGKWNWIQTCLERTWRREGHFKWPPPPPSFFKGKDKKNGLKKRKKNYVWSFFSPLSLKQSPWHVWHLHLTSLQ